MLLLLTIGCQNLSQLGAQPAKFSEAPDIQSPGIPNFSMVCDGLYRGGQPTDVGYETLRSKGIRTIVTLRVQDRYSEQLEKTGFRTHHISFKHIHPETEDVLKFLSIATNPENRPIFVHCRQGVDRTGMMIAVYRMVVQDWQRVNAIAEMKQLGFNYWNVPIENYLLNVDVKKLKRELAAIVANDRVGGHKRIQS